MRVPRCCLRRSQPRSNEIAATARKFLHRPSVGCSRTRRAAAFFLGVSETVMTKNHADMILKTGYFSVAAMVVLFISLFLLTTLHP